MHENAPLCGTFLFLGVASLVVSVFEPRMEGEQQLSPTVVKININRVQQGAQLVEDGDVISIDEVVK